jgi:hypothetical protein
MLQEQINHETITAGNEQIQWYFKRCGPISVFLLAALLSLSGYFYTQNTALQHQIDEEHRQHTADLKENNAFIRELLIPTYQ